MTLCTRHCQHCDDELGYCWKCLSAERDPLDMAASWWWHLESDMREVTTQEETNYWVTKAA